jgi:single-stranded-DNA-specific exonuclease
LLTVLFFDQGEVKLSRTGKVWSQAVVPERDILALKQKYQVSDRVARLVAHRLAPGEDADPIFFPLLKTQMPDASLLPDADIAFAHMHQCLLAGKKLAVWGDYDVDGACSAALMVKYFSALGVEIVPYIPDRFQEGYGPNIAGLLSLRDLGIFDVFVVDCGTTSYDILEQAHQGGLSITIIDHHRVGPSHPRAKAFINPKRMDFNGPEVFRSLCAGGLVFVFLAGLNRYLRWKGYFETKTEPDLLALLDLVALSTICDMMPLRALNRAFVNQGLKVMRQRKNVGLTCLIDASHIRDIPNPIHLGYTLGPRINAGGRIGDASLGVRLLSSNDRAEALAMAQELNDLNQERQSIERATLEKAVQQADSQKDSPYFLVFEEQWHEGVLGIIASHLKENFFKPAFVLTVKGDLLKGSVRSVPGVDISQLIHLACEKGLLITGGGHPMAGGLTFELARLQEVRDFIDDFFRNSNLQPPQPSICVDMALTFEELKNPQFLEDLERVGPFGADYPAPRFLLPDLRLTHVQAFGYNHLRMYGVQANGASYGLVFFRQADKEAGQWLLSAPSQRIDCLVSVQTSSRWGYPRAQLIIEDVR